MADIRPKKGLDEMLPDELLIRAKRIANFRSPDWPIEFSPDQVAALMAGGWEGEYKTEYSDAKRLVAEAIRAGRLSVRTVEIPGKLEIKHHVDEFGRRDGTYHTEKSKKTWLFVDRQACADWLICRGAKPGRYPYIDEWLRAGGVVIGDAEMPQVQQAPAGGYPRSRDDQRIEVILEVVSAAGHDVMSIPDGGKGAAKTECLKRPALFTASTFDNAWKKASAKKRLAMIVISNECMG